MNGEIKPHRPDAAIAHLYSRSMLNDQELTGYSGVPMNQKDLKELYQYIEHLESEICISGLKKLAKNLKNAQEGK